MLNRRGFATFVMCRSCGEPVKCPQCTMPLVYHRDGRLLCHHCDIQVPVPDVCPKCGRGEDDGNVPFERIRRITGYLVGTMDRWNDAKTAEERDRVKHSV